MYYSALALEEIHGPLVLPSVVASQFSTQDVSVNNNEQCNRKNYITPLLPSPLQ